MRPPVASAVREATHFIKRLLAMPTSHTSKAPPIGVAMVMRARLWMLVADSPFQLPQLGDIYAAGVPAGSDHQ